MTNCSFAQCAIYQHVAHVAIILLSFVNVFDCELDEEAPSNDNQTANRLCMPSYLSSETPKILQNVTGTTDKVSKCKENVQ